MAFVEGRRGKDLDGVEEGEGIIRIYYMKNIYFK